MMSVVDVQRLGRGLTVFCEGNEKKKKKKIGQVVLLQSLEIRNSSRCEKRRNVCLFCREDENLCRGYLISGFRVLFCLFLCVANPPMICSTFWFEGR